MRRRYNSKMTRKGQVTVPAEIRRKFEMSPGDRITFVVEEGEVRVEPAVAWVKRTAGILRHEGPPLSEAALKKMREDAWLEVATERDEHSKR